jgi:hypothetical protein
MRSLKQVIRQICIGSVPMLLLSACADSPTPPAVLEVPSIDAQVRMAKYDGKTYRASVYVRTKTNQQRRLIETKALALSFDKNSKRLRFKSSGLPAAQADPEPQIYPIVWTEEYEQAFSDLWTTQSSATPVFRSTIATAEVGVNTYSLPTQFPGSGFLAVAVTREGRIESAGVESDLGYTAAAQLSWDGDVLLGATVEVTIDAVTYITEVTASELGIPPAVDREAAAAASAVFLEPSCGDRVRSIAVHAVVITVATVAAGAAIYATATVSPLTVVARAGFSIVTGGVRSYPKATWTSIASVASAIVAYANDGYNEFQEYRDKCPN